MKGGEAPSTDELLRQVDAGHPTELDVQDETVEPRLFHIREKCLCRRISDRMKASCAQQPAKGLAHLFIVVDDRDVSLAEAAHLESGEQRKTRHEGSAIVL